jgi:hypothetical protein
VCFYMDIRFYVTSSRDGINVNICYVCVYILVYVCMGRSTGWRELLYNFGAHVMCSREGVV